MIKHFLLFAGLLLSMQVIAQTGIGTATPNASAKLDVSSSTMGFLPPRVTLTAANTFSPIVGTPSAAIGLLVYNLGSEGLKAGYYYWNGSNWATIATASSPDQTLDYVSVQSSGQTVVTGSKIMYNTTLSGNIPYNSSTGNFTLIAGKTYRLTAYATLDVSSSAGAELNFVWRNAANAELGNYALLLAANATITAAGQGIVDVIYTPTTNTTVSVYVNWAGGTVALRGGYTYATIQQIGSSATINPWILSGTTTYNTTGNVGIGTSTPTSRLNIVGGGIKIHNGFSRLNSRPLLNTSSIGNYEIRGVGSITGNTQEDLGDDGFLRLSAGGGSDTLVQSSIDISGGSDNTNMDNTIIMRTKGVERLRIDNNGNVNMNGSISLGNPTGNVVIKAAGFVGRGTDITLGNLKVRFAATGNMSLQVSSGSGTISTIGSDQYITDGSGSTTISRSITTSPIYLWPSGLNFLGAGNSETCILIDTNTKMSWRIIGIVGPGYLNNFISIERIL
jgi:hypothetical protein